MTAKDLIIDFINYLFFIALTVFFVFYFILGKRIDELIEILKSMAPLSVFGLIFLFKLRGFIKFFNRSKELEDVGNDEIWYITKRDVSKDRLLILFLSILILALAFIDGEVNEIDIYQSIFCFLYNLFFHWLMFRKEIRPGLRCLNKNSKLIDEIAIYLLPIIMLVIPMSNNKFDTVDILQTVSVFTIMIVRHYILFKKES